MRYEGKVRRRREREAKGLDNDGDDNENENGNNDKWDEDGERRELEDMERKVKEFTKSMEGLMRRTIDREVELGVWVEGLRGLVGDDDENNVEGGGRRVRRRVDAGNGDGEGEEEEELGYAPSQLLKQKIEKNQADWGGRSLTDRFVLHLHYYLWHMG